MIQIRQAVYADIPRIMGFIDENWKKGHIMGTDRTMFEFQHVRNKEVFYVLAEDDTDGKIYGTMGYIPMEEQEGACMSTVMIQALNNPENRMLGEEMARFFEQNMKCRNVISVGVNRRYARVIKGIGGACVDRLRHFYRLAEKKEFRVALIQDCKRLPVLDGVRMVLLGTPEEFMKEMNLDEISRDYPRKSPAYIIHRYYNHPYYKYQIYGLKDKGGMRCAVVGREEVVEGVKVFRLVDLFGREEKLVACGAELDRIIRENDYEYIDFYCYGIKEDILEKAGFIERVEKDKNIIPNYFDPFLRENIEIYFYTWYLSDIHVYRGFGDQDRPSHVPNAGCK